MNNENFPEIHLKMTCYEIKSKPHPLLGPKFTGLARFFPKFIKNYLAKRILFGPKLFYKPKHEMIPWTWKHDASSIDLIYILGNTIKKVKDK
jgi:hypothetical protein